ncbi:rhamnan synthesis F family protein [Aureimonas mangrovi]|uniref:rhamnan synthesis F family protein n=1 Tax=Aureimonas mangrovi TaxID=2758041 RepID=UPI00163DBDF5|nr:rhamnan synthesis F family protein [Aureimonas mangrovi]
MLQLPEDFDPKKYLALNPDVREAGADPAEHFIRYGHAEGRQWWYETPTPGDVRMLAESRVFDLEAYLDRYPDVARFGASPHEHFMAIGAALGYWPSLFFRSDWYNDRNALPAGTNPFHHYMNHGVELGLDPSPFFDTSFYISAYGAEIPEDVHPLTHFIANGHLGFDPSPRFDSRRYMEEYGPIEGNPLKHYLEVGMEAGYAPRWSSRATPGARADSARIVTVRRGAVGRRNALVVTHSGNGFIRPHTARLVRALKDIGYAIHLVVAADVMEVEFPRELRSACDSIFVRENVGFDFAAWAHVWALMPQLYQSEEVLLTNDSIFGPLDTERMTNMQRRIDRLDLDVVGLTSNWEHALHLQSYYLVLKRAALRSAALPEFLCSVVNHPNKDHVIRDYETTFSPRMRRAGLRVGELFPPYRDNRNPSIWDWSRLIDDGFPFIKMALVSGENRDLFPEDIWTYLRSNGHDPFAEDSRGKSEFMFSRVS